jgi:hypothetical protein
MGSAAMTRRFDGGGGGIDREIFPDAGGCAEASVGGGARLDRSDGGGGGGAPERRDGGGAGERLGRTADAESVSGAGDAPESEEVKNSSRRLGPEGLLITRAPKRYE